VDFGLNNDRFTGSLDVFYKKSYDLFQVGPFADGGNFSNTGPQNIGDMSVKGIEFQAGYDVIRKDDLRWNVSFNVTRFERRIDRIALGIPIEFGGIGSGTGGT
ncbi:TonB-dependent receptor, partial [Arthrospira platensis SPKY2]